MNCKKALGIALAAAACFFSGGAEAASPEEQIDVILNLPTTHGDDLEMRLREDGSPDGWAHEQDLKQGAEDLPTL